MEPSGQLEELASRVGTVELNGCPADVPDQQGDFAPAEILRIKEQMANQCFEMSVKLKAGKSKRHWSPSEAERELPDYISELETAKTTHYNKTMGLHRIQIWHAISEKLKQNDLEEGPVRRLTNNCMGLFSEIKALQQESCDLQDQITELQKQRLDLNRSIHEKTKEMDELKRKETTKCSDMMKKGQSNMEKRRKMTTITQHVLMGIILACKLNWRDDPQLRDIAMSMEDTPL